MEIVISVHFHPMQITASRKHAGSFATQSIFSSDKFSDAAEETEWEACKIRRSVWLAIWKETRARNKNSIQTETCFPKTA